jgi:hypothetical protein
VQPVGSVHHGFEWLSVNGAVAPTPGASVLPELPPLHVENLQLCVEASAVAFPDRLNLPPRDTSGVRTARQRT